MPLIQCPDCGKGVSDLAPACVNCGRPMSSPSHSSVPIFKDEKIGLDPSLFLAGSPGQDKAQEGWGAWMMGAGALLLVLYLFSQFLLTILSPFFPPSKPPASRVVSVQSYGFGTINGYDSATGSIIDTINVFKDYENRNLGISGKARHGEKVAVLEKNRWRGALRGKNKNRFRRCRMGQQLVCKRELARVALTLPGIKKTINRRI